MWDTQSYDSTQSQHSSSSDLLSQHERRAIAPPHPAEPASRGKFSLRAFTSAIKGSSNPSTPVTHSHLPSPPSSPTLGHALNRHRSPPLPSPSHFLHPSGNPRTPCPPPASPSPRKLSSKSSQLSLSSSDLSAQPGGLRGKAARVLGEEIVPSGKAAKVMGVTVRKEVGGVGRKMEREMTRERREVVEQIRQSPSGPPSPLPPSISAPRPSLSSSPSSSSSLTPTPISRSRSPAPPPLWLPLPPPTRTIPVNTPNTAVLSLFPVPHERTPSPALTPRRFSSTATASSLSPPPSSPSLSSPDRNDHRSSDVDPSLSLDRIFGGRSPVGMGHRTMASVDSSACGLEGLEFTTSGLSSEVNSPAEGSDVPSSPRMSYFSSASRLTHAGPVSPPPLPPPARPSEKKEEHTRQTGFPSFLSTSPPPVPPRSSSRPTPQPLARSGTMASVASARTRGVQRGNALEALEGRRMPVPREREKGRRERSNAVGGKEFSEKEDRRRKEETPRKEAPTPPRPPPAPKGKSFLDWSDDDDSSAPSLPPPAAPAPARSAQEQASPQSHWSTATVAAPPSPERQRQTISSPLDPFFSSYQVPPARNLPPPLPISSSASPSRRPPPSAPNHPPSLARSTPPPAPLAQRSLVSHSPPPAPRPKAPFPQPQPSSRIPASDSLPSLPSLDSSSTLGSTASSSSGRVLERVVEERRGGERRNDAKREREHRQRPSLDSGFSWLDEGSD